MPRTHSIVHLNLRLSGDVLGGRCSTQLEGWVGCGNEKVGEKRRFHEAGDAVTDESTGLWVFREGGGSGDEKLVTTAENKRKKEVNYNQGSFEGKEKEEAVEKRNRSISEEGNEAQKHQHKRRSGR